MNFKGKLFTNVLHTNFYHNNLIFFYKYNIIYLIRFQKPFFSIKKPHTLIGEGQNRLFSQSGNLRSQVAPQQSLFPSHPYGNINAFFCKLQA
jgi:hypothetical protein